MSSINKETVTSTTFPLDPNHLGIRVVVLVSMFLSAVLGFILVPTITDWLGLILIPRFWIALGGAVGAFALIGTQVERILRRYWPSGKQLIVTPDTVTLKWSRQAVTTIDRSRPAEHSRWYFVIPRKRGIVNSGWYCASLHMRQEENRIILYTFIPPESAEHLNGWKKFERLYPRPLDPAGTSTLQTDPQASLREQEAQRWNSGSEMEPTEFARFLNALHAFE